jgi:hypothetical protein
MLDTITVPVWQYAALNIVLLCASCYLILWGLRRRP